MPDLFAIPVIGAALGAAAATATQILKWVDERVSFFDIPDGAYFYAYLVIGTLATAFVYAAPYLNIDLGSVTGVLTQLDTIGQAVLSLLATIPLGWLFRRLQNVSKSAVRD